MDCHENYEYIRTIGEGAYGSVWLSRKRDGTRVAIKVRICNCAALVVEG